MEVGRGWTPKGWAQVIPFFCILQEMGGVRGGGGREKKKEKSHRPPP